MKIERDYIFKIEFNSEEMYEIRMALEIFLGNSDLHHNIVKGRIKKIQEIKNNIDEAIKEYD